MKIWLRVVKYELANFPKIEAIGRILQYGVFLWRWNIYRDTGSLKINDWEMRVYSQNGEDGILQYIFYKIGTTNKYFVEFGVESGKECNTRYLREQGWQGLWMDASYENKLVKKEFVTPNNIEHLFKKYSVLQVFDLLSIDVDSNDYWIWKAITKYCPRVVVIEYNSVWKKKTDFGVSLATMVALGRKKGYRLVACDQKGINAFFVRSEIYQL